MDKQYVLGIDIGGTNTVIGAVNARGDVLGTTSIKTQTREEFEDYIEDIYSASSQLIDQLGIRGKIHGIGIGAPNANHYSGNIENASNLRWKGILPLCDMISEKFGIPATCTNDANAAAIGEMTYGVARGMKNFIMITLGTGVGSGIVANGEVIYGNDGFAGELGHVVVRRKNARRCGCGRTGCLECYCSATGVARTAREFIECTDTPSLLRSLPIDTITSKDVYDAAVKDDALAKQIFEFTGTILGESIANFVAFSAPEAIVLFGGLAKAGNMILEPLRKAMENNILFIWSNKVKVLISELKDADAAVLGASALGWESQN